MGLLAYAIAGVGFILIGARESFASSNPTSQKSNPPVIQSPKPVSEPNPKGRPFFSSAVLCGVTIVFSLLFVVNSAVSIFNAIRLRDRVGLSIQLPIIGVACVFMLYTALRFSSEVSGFIRFPSSIVDLVVLFGFVEEFLVFYMQRKDTSGIENRYFDLMLVPIAICVVSTVLELKSESKSSSYGRLGRGVGLVLQGTWFMQMGISFYTNLIAQGCSLHEKSRGNYTIKCKGHPEYHRARGIATLQFNCHLALLVVLVASAYSIMAKQDGDGGDSVKYKPLGAEMQHLENHGRFTLDSSEEEEEIREEEEAMTKVNRAVVETVLNGNSHGHE